MQYVKPIQNQSTKILACRMLVGFTLLGFFSGCSGASETLETVPAVATGTDLSHDAVPLYDAALGVFTRPVSTDSALAQAYLDQGFQMMYAFAADEAPASFIEAQKHDPDCAMCFWGEAWSHGPYLNGGMQAKDAPAAYEAIQKAKSRIDEKTKEVERALIEAMAVRFEAQHDRSRRRSLDTLYAATMEDVYRQFPNDTDVGTLFAESLMLLEPRRGRWDVDDPDVRKIHRVLEEVLALDIEHPGACHLYIHATESTTRPEKAEACADHLGNAIPGASHINHMPSHTYNRIGRWEMPFGPIYRPGIPTSKPRSMRGLRFIPVIICICCCLQHRWMARGLLRCKQAAIMQSSDPEGNFTKCSPSFGLGGSMKHWTWRRRRINPYLRECGNLVADTHI